MRAKIGWEELFIPCNYISCAPKIIIDRFAGERVSVSRETEISFGSWPTCELVQAEP